MKRTYSMIMIIGVMAAVLILLVVLRTTGSVSLNSGTRIGFAGNATTHKYTASYVEIKGVFSHTLSPSKDSDTLHCEVKTEKGSLHLTVTERSGGAVLLDKEITENVEFDLKADGRVFVKMETSGHSGSYLFEY